MVAGPPLHDGTIDQRVHPEPYRIGRGEQGALTVQPHKGELLPHRRFRIPKLARASPAAILARFEGYRAAGDLVGIDMARKFLQMGDTPRPPLRQPPRRPEVHPRRPDRSPHGARSLEPEAAAIFRAAWRKAPDDPIERRLLE
jgi:hypothetical protein